MRHETTQIQVPNLESTTDRKIIFTPKQWLERLIPAAYETKIQLNKSELIRVADMTQTGWAKYKTTSYGALAK